MAPGRGADVPLAHCAGLPRDLRAVVWVCDRSSAYPGLAKGGDARMLAYCWAQGRRDFLKAARRGPAPESWMGAWVNDLRTRSGVNAARLEAWDDTVPLDQHPAAFGAHQRALESQRGQRQTRFETHLHDKALPLAKAKVLTSLQHQGDGLTVCVERPEVASHGQQCRRTGAA